MEWPSSLPLYCNNDILTSLLLSQNDARVPKPLFRHAFLLFFCTQFFCSADRLGWTWAEAGSSASARSMFQPPTPECAFDVYYFLKLANFGRFSRGAKIRRQKEFTIKKGTWFWNLQSYSLLSLK